MQMLSQSFHQSLTLWVRYAPRNVGNFRAFGFAMHFRVLVLSAILCFPAFAQGNLPLRLPAPPFRTVKSDARIPVLQAKIRRAQIFDAYQKLTKIYRELGRYDDAAKTLREEAAQYRRKGFADAAIIRERQASRYQTQLQLFIDRLPTPGEQRVLDTRARLEPPVGAYLGAFIDRDDAISRYFLDENFQRHARAEDWTRLVGKSHATYFMYLKYGNKFPHAWVNHLKKSGAIPHIAWEPQSLNQVRDDNYLRNFARQARLANWPIFIRFASEMNGKWTPYHGNPSLYREKFRLVNRVLHEEAPLVATIWCVNNPPLGNIAQYYPGDDGCDWVGVNFYATPFYDNDLGRSARGDHILSLLDPVYKMFASRKPLAIGEFAAGHQSGFSARDESEFAIEKLSLLYGALPRLYPRVKMVNWFSMNTINHPKPQITRNNYALGANARVRRAYLRAVAPSYFLERASSTRTVQPLPRAVRNGENISGIVTLSAWAKTYVARPKFYLEANGKIVFASNNLGAPIFAFDSRPFPIGKLILRYYLYDDKNRFIASQKVVANARP